MQMMRSSRLSFFVAVILLIIRPFIVFSSPLIQDILQNQETKTFGLIRAVRKRKENFYSIDELIQAEEPDQKVKFPLPLLLQSLKNWLRELIINSSLANTSFISFLSYRRSVFDISCHNHRYISFSVFRI